MRSGVMSGQVYTIGARDRTVNFLIPDHATEISASYKLLWTVWVITKTPVAMTAVEERNANEYKGSMKNAKQSAKKAVPDECAHGYT